MPTQSVRAFNSTYGREILFTRLFNFIHRLETTRANEIAYLTQRELPNCRLRALLVSAERTP